MQDIILRFITMPVAIQVFKQDKESFAASKVSIVYYDLIDSVINDMWKYLAKVEYQTKDNIWDK